MMNINFPITNKPFGPLKKTKLVKKVQKILDDLDTFTLTELLKDLHPHLQIQRNPLSLLDWYKFVLHE